MDKTTDALLTALKQALAAPGDHRLFKSGEQITVLNTLDGFSLQPRLSIPFSGPIDVSSVSSSDFFLVDASGGAGKLIGINQVVWEPATNTLHAASDQTLDQDRTYLLVATTARAVMRKTTDAHQKSTLPAACIHGK